MIIGFPFLPGELQYQFTFTSNYFFYNTAVPTHTAHTWSLAVEEQFYLLWPILIIFISSFYHPLIFFLCTVISLVSAWYFGCAEDYSCGLFRNILTSSNLVAFAVGAMYANLTKSKMSSQKISMIIRYSLLAVVPIFLYWALVPFMHFENRFEFLRITAYSLLSICIIHYLLGLEKGFLKTKLIDNRWVGLMGIISYGIYLYHLPIQFYFTRHLIPWASGYGLPHSLYFWFIPFCLTVFGSAYLSFKFVETRFLKLKARFSYTKS
jgi:peptidoglycan/LPS O-acetylase OafA/YrhL